MGWATKYGCCHEIWRVFLLFFPLNHFWDYIRGPRKIETIPSIFPPNCGFTNGDITKKSQQILENMKWTYLKLTPVKCQSLQHYTVQLASHLSFFSLEAWANHATYSIGVDNLFPVEACHFVQWYQNRRPKQNSLKSWHILKHLGTSWNILKAWIDSPKVDYFLDLKPNVTNVPNAELSDFEFQLRHLRGRSHFMLPGQAIGHTGDGRNHQLIRALYHDL